MRSLVWTACLLGTLIAPSWAASPSDPKPVQPISRMAFKSKMASKKTAPTCQLTLMHAYTSKVKKRHSQFVFTGTLTATRPKGESVGLAVVGQNHLLAHTAQGYKSFLTPSIELGVHDSSVRRFRRSKNNCQKAQVCAAYRDNAKHELQALLAAPERAVHLIFPLVQKQPNVVIDLSQFQQEPASADAPLTQFRRCVADLK